NGPTPHPQTTNPAPEGGAVPPLRNKKDEEFTEEDNRNELADIQAIIILRQGLSRPSVSAARRVNTAAPRPNVNSARPKTTQDLMIIKLIQRELRGQKRS
nr:hypothetical protein [Tanacetum cinerariifolium]